MVQGQRQHHCQGICSSSSYSEGRCCRRWVLFPTCLGQQDIHRLSSVVVGTLCAPEYALFVSHSHPNGQAHFNVFSDRKSGRPWGTFTMDTEYPCDEGGPSYVEEIPAQAMFGSKVSQVRMNAGTDDKDWDTLMLARLRFPTDATEPTLQ